MQTSIIYLCCTLIFCCLAPLSGWLSDRFGIYKILLYSISLFAILIVPIFSLIFAQDFVITLIGCAAFIFLITLYQGSIPSIIIRIFPTQVRASGTALSFNATSAIFGGLTPLTLTFLIKETGNYYAIPCYLLASCAITIFAILIGSKLVKGPQT